MEKGTGHTRAPLIVSLGYLWRYEIRCNGFCIIYCYTSTVYKAHFTVILRKDNIHCELTLGAGRLLPVRGAGHFEKA